MISHDLLHLVMTNKVTFDEQDSETISNFDCAMDHSCQALVSLFLVSKLETLDTIGFN